MDDLKINLNEFNQYLLTQLIVLQTELNLQKRSYETLFLHLKPDGQANLEALNQELLKHRSLLSKEIIEYHQANLKGLSVDFQDFLAKLLD